MLLLWSRLRGEQRVRALWLSEGALVAVEWRDHYWPLQQAAPVRRLGALLWFDLAYADDPPPVGAPRRLLLWRDGVTTSQWRRLNRLALRSLASTSASGRG